MNYKNTLLAIKKITSPDGLGMSPKRITVSTSGVTKIIREMASQNSKFKLAVSLHSAIEETRNRLMPFTKKFPLHELLDALKYWYDQTKSKITLINYYLLEILLLLIYDYLDWNNIYNIHLMNHNNIYS